MKEEQGKLAVYIQPNARKNGITAISDRAVHIKIAAPPVKGKANQELVKYLSYVLNTKKNYIKIQRGVTSKRKLLNIGNISQAQAMAKFNALMEKRD